jgi:hypothetical protein
VKPRFPLLLAATFAALSAPALQTRPDRDDAEYVELASRYRSAVRLPSGEGVLIAPRWILTAPEPAQALRAALPAARVSIAGRDHEVESIVTSADLALVLLKEAAGDVEPTPVYRASDESGKGLTIVGHGPAGAIGGAPRTDGKARAALNTVDGATSTTLQVGIKSGDDAPDLQGALTPAELGAPAYLITDEGHVRVAGIARSTDGKLELYTRVSARIAWIEATMWEAAKKEAVKK